MFKNLLAGLSLQQPRSQRMDHVLNLYQPNNSQSASNNLVLMSQGSNINNKSSAPLAMDVDPTLSLSSLISSSSSSNNSHTNHQSRSARGGVGIYPSALLNNVPQSLLNSGSRTSQSLMSSASFAPASLPLDLVGATGNGSQIGIIPGAELHPMHSYQAHHASSGGTSFVPHIVGGSGIGIGSSSNNSNNNGSNNPDSDESPMVGVCVQQSPVVIH